MIKIIIDAHTHIYENGRYGSTEQFLAQMNNANIEKSIVIALPDICSNNWLINQCEQYENSLYAMVFPNFANKNWEKDLISCFSQTSCVGMKIHPRNQNIKLYDPQIERALQNNIFIRFSQ